MFSTTETAISIDLDIQFLKTYKLRTQSLSTVYLFLFFEIYLL